MANWVTFVITVDGKHKYLANINDNNKKPVFWLKDNDEVWSVDGKTKWGYLKWYKDRWYEVKDIGYLAYVEK